MTQTKPRSRKFYPTERDGKIVAAVCTHRALTSDQIALLVWGDLKASSRCRHRLRLLAEHGYLERVEQPVTLAEGRRPLVYFLATGGVELATTVLGPDAGASLWKPSHNRVKWPFLDHLLATNDIRVHFEVAAPRAGLLVHEWIDDQSLATLSMKDRIAVPGPSGRSISTVVGPDGYVALCRSGSQTLHRAFIEADRGTVPLARWRQKVTAYLAYFRSAAFEARYHASKPFRVLTVTTSPMRLANMKEAAVEAGGRSWFWFTTYEAIRDPDQVLLAPTWQMAGMTEPVCFPYPPA
jgi:hypothetical protein